MIYLIHCKNFYKCTIMIIIIVVVVVIIIIKT
jgi:hypothetical protein